MEHANLMRNEDSLQEGLEKILALKERLPNVKVGDATLQPRLVHGAGHKVPDPDLRDHPRNGAGAQGAERSPGASTTTAGREARQDQLHRQEG